MTDAFGGYGGIAQYNRDLATALSLFPGIEAIEILPRIAPDPFSRGDLPERVHQHSPSSARGIYAARALHRALALRPDVVICGHLYHASLSKLVATACGASVVSILHGIETWQGFSRSQRVALAGSARILCVSSDTEERVVKACPNLAGRTHLTYNAVGSQFRPGDRAAARAKFNVTDRTVLLSVGRLDKNERYKGHDRIIPLLANLSTDLPVVLLIAGEGDDELRLRDLADQNGVADFVRFLGKVPKSDLVELYRAADLFALPSTGEGFGIVFVEAMACGTPAIGLAVGGAPDALGHGTLGTLSSIDAFPHHFAAALGAAQRMDETSRTKLSEAVHARFGFAAFQARIAEAMTFLPSRLRD